jgi:tetrahydromethanopterin S-methyltransferase subunit B
VTLSRMRVAVVVAIAFAAALLALWLHAASASAKKGDRVTVLNGQVGDLTQRLDDQEATIADLEQSLDAEKTKVNAWRGKFDVRVRAKTGRLRGEWMSSARFSVFRRAGITSNGPYLVEVSGLGASPSLGSVSAVTDGTCYQISAGSPIEIDCSASQPPPTTTTDGSNCNPNYTPCLIAGASDYDCEGGSGDGPYYTGPVEVIGYDEYDLDRDGDGYGCDG